MLAVGLVTNSCLTLVTPQTVARQAPLPMGFSRQGYWSGLPFPSPGDLPDPGIRPGSPALQADSIATEPPWNPHYIIYEGYWRRKWQPTPVFLPGESQGRGSLVGCSLWGRTESDTTEVTYQLPKPSKYSILSQTIRIVMFL